MTGLSTVSEKTPDLGNRLHSVVKSCRHPAPSRTTWTGIDSGQTVSKTARLGEFLETRAHRLATRKRSWGVKTGSYFLFKKND